MGVVVPFHFQTWDSKAGSLTACLLFLHMGDSASMLEDGAMEVHPLTAAVCRFLPIGYCQDCSPSLNLILEAVAL